MRLNIKVQGRDPETSIPLDEFRERFDEFPLDRVFDGSLEVWDADVVTLKFDLNKSIFGDSTASVVVTGSDRGRVQEIKTRVKEGDAGIEAARRAEDEAQASAKADTDFKRQEVAAEIGGVAATVVETEAIRERDRQKAVRPKEGSSVAPLPQSEPSPRSQFERSRFSRFINHPWTIGLGATILGGTVVALVVALILGSP